MDDAQSGPDSEDAQTAADDLAFSSSSFYSPVQTPSSATDLAARQGVHYDHHHRAWVSVYTDSETGLEDRQYFFPHKYGSDKSGYELAEQAAVKYRRDLFLTAVQAKKDDPENVTKLKRIVEDIRSHATSPQNLVLEDLEEAARLKRIASAKKVCSCVKSVLIPSSPCGSGCSTSEPGSPLRTVLPLPNF